MRGSISIIAAVAWLAAMVQSSAALLGALRTARTAPAFVLARRLRPSLAPHARCAPPAAASSCCSSYSRASLRLSSPLYASAAAAARYASTRPAAPAAPQLRDAQLPKHFPFRELEPQLYRWWEGSGFFKPDESSLGSRKPYVIPMPPPNVTGFLHMGHALMLALQDILARFHRMRGRPTLWLPGTDHAGIATQLQVEKALAKEGLKRTDLTREQFLERVWRWKEEKGDYIVQQMRRMGTSADWSRLQFTLNGPMSEAVTEAFVRLYEKGLIYKGNYLVNWSPNLQTAISDLEVDHVEEPGKLYYFKYMLEGQSGEYIPVATTRPETILGDTAVCVHPDDERYKRFIGKRVVVPTQGRTVPVIADNTVDMEFGTGALKVTPAHDPVDYELAKKHRLPSINIMTKSATINENGGAYEGLDRFDCRSKIWQDMEAQGLTLRVENHLQRVPRSQRGGEVVEPMLSDQWFLRMDGMSKAALAAVGSGKIRILPERFEKVYNRWMENMKDWCISRQLWWGHRVPVYYIDGTDEFVVARNEEEALIQAQRKFGPGVTITQDEDVLDTWFSSALWPFSTTGWPANEGKTDSDLQKYYPATVLETGHDILFFWVARMVMMGLELTGKAPFEVVYMHGLVRDGEGQKMSKTKGNVLDPIDMIEKYGADATRFALVTGAAAGQDIPISTEKLEGASHFVNKLWNAGKYVRHALQTSSGKSAEELRMPEPIDMAALSGLPERYIVSKCHLLEQSITEKLEAYNIAEAAKEIQDFLWDDFADWYIESSKKSLQDPSRSTETQRVLLYVWSACLRLLHPYMPYLTEALWQALPAPHGSVMATSWPSTQDERSSVDAAAIARYEAIQGLVRGIRNARAEHKVEPGRKITVMFKCSDSALREAVEDQMPAICMLARVSRLAATDVPPAGEHAHVVVKDGFEAYLPMQDMFDADKEAARLQRQADQLNDEIRGLEVRLQSKGFVEKASPSVVAETRAAYDEKKERLAVIVKSLQDIEATR